MNSFALETRPIPVTIDKSHLITIGEKLYSEKMSFVRELVNNAYDADATEIRIVLSPSEIIIGDNGSGMDEKGLRQYFTIGSSLKKEESVSPKFGRKRIGEFGIGKFAALAACKQFEIDTQSGAFRARLIFDKESWSRHEDWHLNIDVLSPNMERNNGTIITLRGLEATFALWKLRRYLMERTPILAPDFTVLLNGEKVTGEVVAGRQLPIRLQSPFGPITGQITIVPIHLKNFRFGVSICVKDVMIRNELFGLENSRKWGVTRITGRVNADFLPITSNRDDFIRDSEAFLSFSELMKKEIKKAVHVLHEEGDKKANLQASKVLKEALTKIGRALKGHKNLFPEAQVPMGSSSLSSDPDSKEGFDVSNAQFVPLSEEISPDLLKRLKQMPENKVKRRKSSTMLGSKSVIRSLRIANFDIAVRLEHLGEDEESLVSGGIIYVNLDHPLYRTYKNNDELLTLHVTRVITKELTLQAGIKDAQEAFALQSGLLTDALKEKGI